MKRPQAARRLRTNITTASSHQHGDGEFYGYGARGAAYAATGAMPAFLGITDERPVLVSFQNIVGAALHARPAVDAVPAVHTAGGLGLCLLGRKAEIDFLEGQKMRGGVPPRRLTGSVFMIGGVLYFLKQNHMLLLLEGGATHRKAELTPPDPLMRAVKRLGEKSGVPTYLSLETHMGCGVGACLVCAVKLRDKNGEPYYGHVCKNGPVFSSEEVVFDD